MLSDKMQKALNDQINAEMFSSYLYLAIAAYFEEISHPGFANWMRVQSQEEDVHAMKIYDYIIERRGRVKLAALEAPQTEWDSPLAAFEASLEHEQYITSRINDLVKLARAENDYATELFLQWFIDEQVEEESSVDAVVQDMRRVQDFPPGMFILERELGSRAPGAEEGE